MNPLFCKAGKHASHAVKHLRKHGHKYAGGMFAGFAVVKAFVLLAGFFSAFSLGNIFAQGGGFVLDSGNIADYCSSTATDCDLTNTNIASIAPDTFAEYTNLHGLSLGSNQLTSLDPTIFNGLSNLQYLDLDNNGLTSLDPTIFNGLSNLKDLDLNSNKITSLDPDIFDGLSNLEELYFYRNKISSLDPDIFNGLSNLQYLDISVNGFVSLDSNIFNGLSDLKLLNIASDHLTSLDSNIFNGLSNLEDLRIQNNQLTSLDSTIFNGLSNLQYLDLDNNGLTSLDPTIFNGLSNLKNLDISFNQITSLDQDIFDGLSALQYLHLNFNQLTSLPEDMINLTSLLNGQGLNVSYNRIDYRIFSSQLLAFIDAKHVTQYGNGSSTQMFCGNGVIESPETCDDGDNNGTYGYCDNSCYEQMVCGNGIVQGPEVCDDGSNNGQAGYCDSSCDGPTPATCGNGIIEDTEACDDGENNGIYGYCNSTCDEQIPAICGNGVVEDTEACDDGNTNDGDGCSSVCELEHDAASVCGNGIIETGEQCDDGNTDIGDGCDASCQLETTPIFDCSNTDVPQAECEALVALYEDTNGSGWTTSTNWLQSNTICGNRYGVSCNENTINQINLQGNNLVGILPSELSKFSNLQDLYLNDNHINTIKNGSFNGLSNLQYLYLSNNQLSSLDPNIFNGLSNLQYLGAYGNQLTSLDPNIFSGLSNLNQLYLSDNQLTSLDPNIFNGLSSLQSLYLNDNQLTSLDPNIFNGLSNLNQLYLSDNQLSSLDPNIFNGLSNLQYLYLSDNQLTSLDSNIFNGLSNLNQLYLNDNQLTSLPENLTDLTSLQDGRGLSVDYNSIDTHNLSSQLLDFIDAKSTDSDWRSTQMICGDGVIVGSEVCDDGTGNGNPNQCNLTCDSMMPAVCGNSIIEKGETCDDGKHNGEAGYCASSCTLPTASEVQILGIPSVGQTVTGSFINASREKIGEAGFSSQVANTVSMALDSQGTAYVVYDAYSDNGNGPTRIMKFSDGKRANTDDFGKLPSMATNISLAFDANDTPYIAYSDGDNNYKATVMKFIKGGWKTVGEAGFSADSIGTISLAFDSTRMIPYIAYGTNTEIGVMRYIDDNRENVGDPKVSSQSVGNVSLALDANNIPYITYKEMLSKRTYISYIMKLMGKNRITVGDSFFHTSVDSIAFDSDNVPYIAYTDDRNDLHPRSVVIKQFIDDTRQTVGNPRFSYGQSYALSLTFNADKTVPYVAFSDSWNGGKITAMRLDVRPKNDIRSTSTYKRYRDGVAISGATSIAYHVASLDAGKNLSFEVTPIDTHESVGTPIQSDGVFVAGASNVQIIGSPTTGSTLTGSYDFIDNDSSWKDVNIDGLPLSDAVNPFVFDRNNMPYVSVKAYDDPDTQQHFASMMMRLDGDSRTQFGDTLASGDISQIVFDTNNILYAADIIYADTPQMDTSKIIRLDAGSWTTVGDELSGEIYEFILDKNNIPYVLNRHWDNDTQLYDYTVMKFFDGDRQPLGTISFDIGKVKSFYFDDLNIPHLAYQDNGNYNVIDVRTFQNDTWEQTNTIRLPEGGRPGIRFDAVGNIYIAGHQDNTSDRRTTVMKYIDNGWQIIGSTEKMDGMINNFRLDPMGTPYLSNSEDLGGGNKTILIIRFDNNSWQDISITYNQLQCTVATFDRNNAPYVACRDAESKLSTFKKLVTTSEGASTYQRYRNKERIHTATAKTYTLTPQDIDTTITFEVTPIDSNGSPVGGAVKSTGLWIPGLSGEVFCGNGIIESGENCDDGLNNGVTGYCNESCSATILQPTSPMCGDGIIASGEVCDDGENNGLTGYCNNECSALIVSPTVPVCGNGNIETGEFCDEGMNNGAPGYCNSECSAILDNPICGNGVIETGEVCDEGMNNGVPGYCNSNCSAIIPISIVPVCGNTVIETGEVCDDGTYNGLTGYCNSDCSATIVGPTLPVCGNTIIETGEICDDGIDNGIFGYCSTSCNYISVYAIMLTKDKCPNNKDCSPSYYDHRCGVCPSKKTHESAGGGTTSSAYSEKMNLAYKWMFDNGLISAPTIQQADINGYVIREQMAKMITEFAIKVLNKKPNSLLACSFTDTKNESTEMSFYIKTACQLGLMGRASDGKTTQSSFNPTTTITRAQFATVLSRLLYGDKYNSSDPKNWADKHLQALNKAGIITNISTPSMNEIRGYVMLMLMRSSMK